MLGNGKQAELNKKIVDLSESIAFGRGIDWHRGGSGFGTEDGEAEKKHEDKRTLLACRGVEWVFEPFHFRCCQMDTAGGEVFTPGFLVQTGPLPGGKVKIESGLTTVDPDP